MKLHGSGEKILRLDDDFQGDAVRYMQFALIEELDNACRAGYMQLDAAQSVYRPTIKGACLMTWQELWPFKGIRLAGRRRREAKLLADLAYQVPELSVR